MANYDKHVTAIPMAYPRKCTYCGTVLPPSTGTVFNCWQCSRAHDEASERLSTTPNTIEVSVIYSTGGMNYFTYKNEPRGYALMLSPIRVSDGCQSFLMGARGNEAGIKYFLAPAKAYNRKLHATLAAKLLPHAEQLATWHYEGNRQATRELIETHFPELRVAREAREAATAS
jgi:hypothetical protein